MRPNLISVIAQPRAPRPAPRCPCGMRLWSARTCPRFGPTRHVASRKAATCRRTPKAMSAIALHVRCAVPKRQGLAHSKTLRVRRAAPHFRQVLDCGGPPPLFPGCSAQFVFIHAHPWLKMPISGWFWPKSFISTAFPDLRMFFPMSEKSFPVSETSFPTSEIKFPVCRARFPVRPTSSDARRTMFPVRRTLSDVCPALSDACPARFPFVGRCGTHVARR